jgi:hypothetical protein
MEFLSTTSLANELNMPPNELFSKLKSSGWIDNRNGKWILTDLGKQKGGQIRSNPKFGEYVVWPENLKIESTSSMPKLLNATAIGKCFGISSKRLNLIFSELGWIEKTIAGWELTSIGKSLGGKQFENDTSGGTYALWPEAILTNKSLKSSFETEEEKPQIKTSLTAETTIAVTNSFREKFEAKHRTKDGHYVRSKSEVIIDNALYDYGLAHAYEKKLSIEEDVYTDFYLPAGKVYIEFWGLEDDPKYLERKKKKIDIYKKYELKLIELNEDDVRNLDDVLPKKLLKFSIPVYS